MQMSAISRSDLGPGDPGVSSVQTLPALTELTFSYRRCRGDVQIVIVVIENHKGHVWTGIWEGPQGRASVRTENRRGSGASRWVKR